MKPVIGGWGGEVTEETHTHTHTNQHQLPVAKREVEVLLPIWCLPNWNSVLGLMAGSLHGHS